MRNYLHIICYISHIPETSLVFQLRVGPRHIQPAHILLGLRGQALLLYPRALPEPPGHLSGDPFQPDTSNHLPHLRPIPLRPDAVVPKVGDPKRSRDTPLLYREKAD